MPPSTQTSSGATTLGCTRRRRHRQRGHAQRARTARSREHAGESLTRARQVLTVRSAKGVAANEDQATGQRMSALAQSCCIHVASTCGIKLTLEEFSCKNRYYDRGTQGYEIATKITVKTLELLYFYGSGGRTRTHSNAGIALTNLSTRSPTGTISASVSVVSVGQVVGPTLNRDVPLLLR